LEPGKRKRTEGSLPESPQQKKISQFFTEKLSKEEGHEHAQQRLIRIAEEREDRIDEEELRRKKVKVARREANTSSQRRSRARKRAKEVTNGVRNENGKIKKVCRYTPYTTGT